MNGASAAPIDEPLSKSAPAQPLSRRGNHSETALVAPGQLAASPSPSAKRNAQKLRRPTASAGAIAATEHQATARLNRRRVPSRSTIRPAMVWPTAYAIRNEISTQAKSLFVQVY